MARRGSALTKLGDDQLLALLDEHRALLGESIANDYGSETVRSVMIRIAEFEAEVDRRGAATPGSST
ncbi:MAG: hypothetical protein EOP30_09425 [Rhodococcus sp. (in: high G+C Gram-positive bacteria)]|nr:MAG: hypothetical protein EOP30_09425 [Rhodococcus sp. (in: high G+C Gram-positive bacteria)]